MAGTQILRLIWLLLSQRWHIVSFIPLINYMRDSRLIYSAGEDIMSSRLPFRTSFGWHSSVVCGFTSPLRHLHIGLYNSYEVLNNTWFVCLRPCLDLWYLGQTIHSQGCCTLTRTVPQFSSHENTYHCRTLTHLTFLLLLVIGTCIIPSCIVPFIEIQNGIEGRGREGGKIFFAPKVAVAATVTA